MKTSTKFISLLAFALLLGCLPTVNPVYTENDLIFDEAILGVWNQDGGGSSWVFSKKDEKSYLLQFTDNKSLTGQFVAHLAEIKGTKYLDLFPEKPEEQSGFYAAHMVPLHTIYRVVQTQPELKLAGIDFKWLKEYLDEHPGALQMLTINDRKIVSSSTKELQAFVIEHKERFTAEIILQRPAP